MSSISMTVKSKFFDYTLDFKSVNFRDKPELYKIGRGEQGVLLVEPYKSEILPYWRFRNEDVAKESSKKIYSLFVEYKKHKDFVGMDMARKFLQMGYTRARRYANHKSGRKYISNPQNAPADIQKTIRNNVLPQNLDWETNEKALAAKVFYDTYIKVKNDPIYKTMKKNHQEKYHK